MMEFPSIPTAAALGLILIGIYNYIIYPAFLSPLAKIPAAKWHARFCPLWSYYIKYANIENRTLYNLHRKYESIVRMGPSELSVNCYEGGLKVIYSGGFPKSDFYTNRFSNYGYENLFTMMDTNQHALRRRMLSNVYSKSVVLASPNTQETSQVILFQRILPIYQKSSDANTPVEVHKLNYAYTIDWFMGYQFGLGLACNFIQDAEKREWYLRHFYSRRPHLFWASELPELTRWVQKLTGVRLLPKWCVESTSTLEAWGLEICDRAEQLLSSGDADVGDPWKWPAIYAAERQKFQEADAKSGYVDVKQVYPRRLEIASDMFDHHSAAQETSGDTLTWLYYEMSRRPGLQAQLRQELLTLDPPIGFPATEGQALPDFKSLDSLPLLDAILQETLRLWVSVPGVQPRVTPNDCVLAGYSVPPGVRVQSSAYTLHRNPEVFPDPEVWNPMRWIETTPEELAEMRHWHWAFGSGPNMCIGNNIAVHVMKLAVAGIYTNYTTSIFDAEGIEQDDGFTVGPKGNKLWLQFKHV